MDAGFRLREYGASVGCSTRRFGMENGTARFRALILEFDRKSPTVLTEAAVRFRACPGYFDGLAELAGDHADAVSSGATWLIKHELENGRQPPPGWVRSLAAALDRVGPWDAKLHICQSIRLLPVPDDCRPTFHVWLLPLLDHTRPFLRAWAVDALCRLADEDGALGAKTAAALDRLAEDPAASVRARVRALRKEFRHSNG